MKAGDLVSKLSNVHPDTQVLFGAYNYKGNYYYSDKGFNVREEQAIQLSEGEFDFLSNHFDVQDREEQYLQDGDSGLDFFSVLVIEEA